MVNKAKFHGIGPCVCNHLIPRTISKASNGITYKSTSEGMGLTTQHCTVVQMPKLEIFSPFATDTLRFLQCWIGKFKRWAPVELIKLCVLLEFTKLSNYLLVTTSYCIVFACSLPVIAWSEMVGSPLSVGMSSDSLCSLSSQNDFLHRWP